MRYYYSRLQYFNNNTHIIAILIIVDFRIEIMKFRRVSRTRSTIRCDGVRSR